MTNLEKFYKIRHDFYNHDELDYDSISYFTSIEQELKALEVIKSHITEQIANTNGKPRKCLLVLVMETEKEYDLLKEVML